MVDKESKLFRKKESAWLQIKESDKKEIFNFSEDYKSFLQAAKTEREVAKEIIKILKNNGFKDISSFKKLKSGDKVYQIFKEKLVYSFIVGKNPEDVKLINSHTDALRLDLKPEPLVEDSDFALLKSHYYGGLKPYNWVNTPLELRGVIQTKSKGKVEICLDKEDDPKFLISELLIHLSKDNLQKKGKEVVDAEQMSILVGSIPVNDKDIKEKVKYAILEELNKKYSIVEEDFIFADLEFVPSLKPFDIGFDRGLIGSYAHDNRSGVYLSLRALLDSKLPKSTNLCVFYDREEIGSLGNTGANGFTLQYFFEEYLDLINSEMKVGKLFENMKAISADVCNGQNPNFKDANDPTNVAYLGRGLSVTKQHGSAGKYMSSEASSEYMNYFRKLFDKYKTNWQTGQLGKIGKGGGGTISVYMSRYGIDCIDMGIPVLGMHSPCEVASKIDVYESYKFFKIFFEE